jgi:Helix-turn-helix domain
LLPQIRPLLDMTEARAALGGISAGLLYRLMRDGEIASVKIAGRTMFRPEDLDAYIEANVRRSSAAADRGHAA